MERGLSLDDLMDGIHKLTSAGFPRNDSEALFQDFIRRIPSSGNLTASDSLNYLDPAQQAQLQQSVQQFQQQAQQHSGNAVLRSTSSTDLQEVGGLEVKNFPRVASLDYLQHLVQQSAANQTLKQPSTVPEHPTSDSHSSPPPSTVSQEPAATVIPTMPMLSTHSKPAALTSAPPHSHALAAALQLGQLTGLQLPRPISHDQGESPSNGKAEVRRARRMLSNRESARRSRRRKQEHLSTMEEQLAVCMEEKQKVEDQHKEAAAQVEHLRQDNAALRRELDECHKQMRAAGLEVVRSNKGGCHQSDAGEPAPKKLCNGHRDTKARGSTKQPAQAGQFKRELDQDM